MADTQIIESDDQVFYKDPNAVLDFIISWATWLATGETILTTAWTVGTGLTKDSDTNTTTTATAWFSGGTAGTDYFAACKITTTDSRTDERSILIRVRNR